MTYPRPAIRFPYSVVVGFTVALVAYGNDERLGSLWQPGKPKPGRDSSRHFTCAESSFPVGSMTGSRVKVNHPHTYSRS